MRSSVTEPPWYQVHYKKPYAGEVELFALAAGRYLIDQPLSLPTKLGRALRHLLPLGGKSCGRTGICTFLIGPPPARIRPARGIGVMLKVKILCAEEEFLQRLEIAGFRHLPPNVDIRHLL